MNPRFARHQNSNNNRFVPYDWPNWFGYLLLASLFIIAFSVSGSVSYSLISAHKQTINPTEQYADDKEAEPAAKADPASSGSSPTSTNDSTATTPLEPASINSVDISNLNDKAKKLIKDLKFTDLGIKNLSELNEIKFFNNLEDPSYCGRALENYAQSIRDCWTITKDKNILHIVDDPRFYIDIEISFAHEALHALFINLTEGNLGTEVDIAQLFKELDRVAERQKIKTDNLLIFYGDLPKTKCADLPTTVEELKKQPMNSLLRCAELHSVIGSEFKDIGSYLENYYALFFDRQTVIDPQISNDDLNLSQEAKEMMAELKFTDFAKLNMIDIKEIKFMDDIDNSSYCGQIDQAHVLGCWTLADPEQGLGQIIHIASGSNLLGHSYNRETIKVTFAHEVLHAFFFDLIMGRFSDIEIKKVFEELDRVALEQKAKTDEALSPYYNEFGGEGVKCADLGDNIEQLHTKIEQSNDENLLWRCNELHSFIGTEFQNIGPYLEKHYDLFFDRSEVFN